MSVRDLTILGCASQVPTRHRNHNGYLLRWDEEGILFDPGEGTQRQFILARLSPTTITRIFISHFHGDHSLGLAGIFQRLSLDGVEHTVHVYYPACGQQFLDRLRTSTSYHDRLTTRYHPVEGDGVIDECAAFTIEARALKHSIPAFGYRLVEPARRRFDPQRLADLGIRGPMVSELARDGSVVAEGRTVQVDEVSELRPGAVFAFVMDTAECPAAVELARDADLLVIESTYLDSEAETAHEYGHLSVGQACGIANQAGARRAVFTHFSQRYPSVEPFKEATAESFPNAIIAEDMLRVDLRSGAVSRADEEEHQAEG